MPLAKTSKFVDGVLQSQLLDDADREEFLRIQADFEDTRALAQEVMKREWLTAYQINQILQGKGKNLILGPFVLLERVGEGGMGQVFKARQKLLNRIVALKVIRQECLSNPKVILRFQREIRAAGQLSHPHIVRAYDADQVNGTYYIAMEYIEGVDLARMVKEEGPLRVDRACEYIRQAALGLQHAFERGLVHRDIKPANLLVARAVSSDRRRSSGYIRRPPNLDARRSSAVLPRGDAIAYPFGVVKILDMGLARCSDTIFGRASTHLTQIGSVMGTPEYIAPEQARDSHTSDIRADLYSLGCTLFYLLTGLPPFPFGTLTEKLLQHQLDEAPSVAGLRRERVLSGKDGQAVTPTDENFIWVPKRVEDLLRRLMAKQPEDRHQTPQELANELQDILVQLANGSLLAAEDADRTTMMPALAESPSPAAPDDATVIATPDIIAAERARPRRGNGNGAKIAVLLAAAGGFVLIAVATIAAVLMSKSSLMQASAVPNPPAAKARDAGEPAWKHAVKKAIAQRGSWEEARQEIVRQRQSAVAAADARMLDDILQKMPTAFDELQRAKFDGVMPAFLPPDVIGMYGFSKAAGIRPVTSLAVCPNGRWVADAEDNGIRVFDLLGSAFPFKIAAHTDRVTRVAASPDGRLLASASDDGTVKLWEFATRQRTLTFNKHQRPVTQLAFNHDGTLIASAGRDGAIRVWDPRTGAEIRRIEGQAFDVIALAFAPDGKTLFWGGAASEIRWIDVKAPAATPSAKLDLKFASLRVLAVQPHGKLVILGNGQGSLAVHEWNGAALVERATLRDHQQIHQVAFAPDGKSFVSAGSDPSVTLWNASSLTSRKTWKAPRGVAHSAAFSTEGRHFVLGGVSGNILVIRLSEHDRAALLKTID